MATTVVYVISFILLLILHPGNHDIFVTIYALFHTPPHIFAGVCCIVYAFRGGHTTKQQRIGWFLIGLSCFSYVTGDAFYAYYDSKGPVPCPSWADAGWLCVFPFLIGGVILLFGSMPNAGRARLLLDNAIATSSVSVFIWYFLLQELWHRSGIGYAGKLVSVSYPLADVGSVFSALVLLNSKSANRTMRRSLALLACGIIFWSFSDTLYTYGRFLGRYEVGSWFDWGWPFGALLIAYACLFPLWSGRSRASEQDDESLNTQAGHARSLLRVMAPYAAAGGSLLAVTLYDYWDDGHISTSIFAAALGLMLLVAMRQVFTLLENRHLTTQLSTQLSHNEELTGELRLLNESLEQRVAQRTQQLGALLQLTQAVNSTLQVEVVLDAALEHTRQVLQAEAALIWLPGETTEQTSVFMLPLHIGLEEYPKTVAFLTTQAIHDQAELLPLPTTLPQESGQGVCLRAPLLWQQRLLGMIGIVRWNAGVETTEWEVLQSIGLEVGMALEHARKHRAAVDAADKDAVTNLYNHRAIHQFLETEMECADRSNGALALIMMDVNNFKMFNDTYGHPVGDQVLKDVAQAIRDECGQGDYAARYGGDEFLIVLSGADQPAAVSLAERLQERMRSQGFRRAGEERTVPVTLSFGIAAFPEDSTSRHELLAIADANLYAAKQSEEGIRSTSETQRTNRQLLDMGSFSVLDAMITAVDNKDRYTRRHSEDVTEYALWIAEELGVSEETLRIVRIGGLLHDVGKIGVPDEILRKPGRLTPEEYEVLKRHPHLGSLIVGAIPGMEIIVDAVRSHHERFDGQGYPDQFAGEDIPLLGRMMAVADAVSAMTTDRPYRKGLEWSVAMQEVRNNIGTQFDPVMAHAFLRAAEKRRPTTVEQTPLTQPVEVPLQKAA